MTSYGKPTRRGPAEADDKADDDGGDGRTSKASKAADASGS